MQTNTEKDSHSKTSDQSQQLLSFRYVHEVAHSLPCMSAVALSLHACTGGCRLVNAKDIATLTLAESMDTPGFLAVDLPMPALLLRHAPPSFASKLVLATGSFPDATSAGFT